MQVSATKTSDSAPFVPMIDRKKNELDARLDADLVQIREQCKAQLGDAWEESPSYRTQVDKRLGRYVHDYNVLYDREHMCRGIIDDLEKARPGQALQPPG